MRVYKRGRFWYIDFKYNDYRYRKRISHIKKEAENHLNKINSSILNGTFESDWGSMYGLSVQTGMSIADGVAWYLDHYAQSHYKEKGYKQIKLTLQNFSKIVGPEREIKTLSRKDIEQYKTARLETVKPISIDRELSIISGCLNRLAKYDVIDTNPIAGKIEYYHAISKRERFATPAELKKILSIVQNEQLKLIILIAVFTGMRRSNIVNLKRENIDFEKKVFVFNAVKVRQGKTKKMIVPIYAKLAPLLSEYIKKNNITDNLFSMSAAQITTAWGTLVRTLNIQDLKFHDLRRTFSTVIYNTSANAEPAILQSLLGHSKIDMTMNVYTVKSIEKKRNIIDSAKFDIL